MYGSGRGCCGWAGGTRRGARAHLHTARTPLSLTHTLTHSLSHTHSHTLSHTHALAHTCLMDMKFSSPHGPSSRPKPARAARVGGWVGERACAEAGERTSACPRCRPLTPSHPPTRPPPLTPPHTHTHRHPPTRVLDASPPRARTPSHPLTPTPSTHPPEFLMPPQGAWQKQGWEQLTQQMPTSSASLTRL